MDALQARHKFDQIEAALEEIKQDILNHTTRGDNSYEDLEYELEQAERELEKAEEKAEECESELDDCKADIRKAVTLLESFLGDIIKDHPEYNVDDLESAINKLNDI